MAPAARFDEWCEDCILEVETLIAEAEESNGNVPVDELDRPRYRTYNVDDLEAWVSAFEEKYGIPSSVLFAMATQNLTPVDVPGYERHTWLSFYREYLELKDR